MSDGRAIAEQMRVRWILLAIALVLGACSSQVVTGNPWTYVPLKGTQLTDKVDLLFAIDNSPSMGDKQELLAAAIPTLVGRLLDPRCVDANASSSCSVASDCASLAPGADCDATANGGKGRCFVPGDGKGGSLQCSTIAGTKPEFFPVHDLHVGFVSSSLGGGGSSDVCAGGGDEDDKGRLLNRTAIENANPVDGNGGNFLAWLPASDPLNSGKDPPNVTAYTDGQASAFTADFQSLARGVQEHGCGLEAQLESWYRFLVQPDPYDTIALSNDDPPRASFQGVDATLLKMRHDFLRPDSIVVIVQLTDEEDSWSDPMWLGGYGWTSRTMNFPGGPGGGAGPRGTTECDEPPDLNNPTTWGPNNPDCTSCAFPGSKKPVSGTDIGQDPNCNACPPFASSCAQKGWWNPTTWTAGGTLAIDGLDVRYGSQYMRTRYGFDNQHDVRRYIDGLRSATVPDRDNEAHPPIPYTTTKRNCTNPLYARGLPDGSDTSPGALCLLQAGPRTPDRVFYALIGGVPNGLAGKLDLSPDDWTKIVGKDPQHYLFDGIDPHMIESTVPRTTLQAPGTAYSLGNDPDNGREWNTTTSASGIDLEYACTFDLPAPKDCAASPSDSCECAGNASAAVDGPPLCSPTSRTTQVKGKAYPTIRELRVAQGLGAQSVVASICAKDVTSAVTSPTYGYNPAIDAILNRLDVSLGSQCLGASLPVDGCILLAQFPESTDQSVCDSSGLEQPPASLLKDYQAAFRASLDAGPTQPVPALCELPKLATCGAGPGWCLETNTDGCAQKIAFAPGSPPPGTTISLACTAVISN